MSINIHLLGCELSVYTAPISAHGFVAAWRGRKPNYRGGYVVRVAWLGIVVRWGKSRRYARVGYTGLELIDSEEWFFC